MIASIYLQPLGYSQFTSFSSATSLLASTASTGLKSFPASLGMTTAVIAVEGAGIRWTDDGVTTPTASIGMPVAAGQTLSYTGNFPAFIFIGQTAGAIVNVSYYA